MPAADGFGSVFATVYVIEVGGRIDIGQHTGIVAIYKNDTLTLGAQNVARTGITGKRR